MAVGESSIGDRAGIDGLRRRRFKYADETVIRSLLLLCAAISVLTTGAIVVVLFEETVSFFREVSIADFLLDTTWQPNFAPQSFGIWELVAGTANILLWTLIIAIPLGLASAIYLSEYASPRLRQLLKPMLEALAGVPTVVYAYFALTFITPDVLAPLLGDRIQQPFNALGASIIMAVMITPTIASISEDAMGSVPRDLREAAYGLGATRLEVAIRVVVPAALSGIVASILLAMARVVGETMIVAVAAGSNPSLTLSPFDQVQTMTGFMLQIGGGDAGRGTLQYQSLFAVGAALFVFTFIFNLAAQALVRRFREVYV